jgi:hypothetical protein
MFDFARGALRTHPFVVDKGIVGMRIARLARSLVSS